MSDITLLDRSRHPRRGASPKKERSLKRSETQSNPALTGYDKPLLYTVLALSVLGLVAVYSASAMEAMDKFNNSLFFVQRQFFSFILGYLLMFTVARIPFFSWARAAKPIAFGVIALLLYTMMSGVEAYGAERWIRIFGFQFQPSELGKISVLLLLAQALSHKEGMQRSLQTMLNGFLVLLTLGLIFKQPSLSMTIILASVSAGMMFISGMPLWILGGGGLAGSAFVIYKLMHTEYQMRRIRGWLDPWKDAQDTGYNLIQSLYAIGSGGLIGAGLGMSHQKLYYLPFQYTDFIFSVWAEEWGFVGSALLIGLFLMLLYRGFVIAKTCRSSFGQLLAMGITMMLAVQIVINLSVATGLFPVTGVTLPLISFGGTSVLVTLFMVGILLGISRYRVIVTPLTSRTTP